MQFVLVCSTPRSGSTLLASTLRETGACVGMQEYFERHIEMPQYVLPAVGLPSVEAVTADLPGYVERIKKLHAGSNRPLGLKIQWHHMTEWAPHGLDLQKLFPGARYIHCRRLNLAAQGVSLVRALQTQGWVAGKEQSADAEYGFWKFMYEMSALIRDDAAWDPYFKDKGIEPYRIVYEDLDADFRGEVLKLLDWLDVRLGPLARWRLRPPLRKQRGQLNREWETRFYRDLLHWYTQWEKLVPLEERRRIWGRERG